MNDELNKVLIDLLNNSKDFVVEQAPDVVQQLLAWNLTCAIMCCVICIPWFIALAYVARHLPKWWNQFGNASYNNDYIEGIRAIGMTLACAISIVTIPMVFISNLTIALQIWIAPKIFLLEYASKLVK